MCVCGGGGGAERIRPFDFFNWLNFSWFEQKFYDEMTEAEFAQNLAAVVASKLEKDKNLNEESNRHWKPIQNTTQDFDRGTFNSAHW